MGSWFWFIFCVGRATTDSESQRVDTTGEMLQCLCDIKVNDGWCTEGATSTFALSPLGRRYESAELRRRECEGEEAIVVSHLRTSPLYLRTFAFASSHLYLCNFALLHLCPKAKVEVAPSDHHNDVYSASKVNVPWKDKFNKDMQILTSIMKSL